MHKRIQNPLEYQRSGFIIVNGFQLLTTLSKSSILHICLASEYASLFMHRDYFQKFFFCNTIKFILKILCFMKFMWKYVKNIYCIFSFIYMDLFIGVN